MSVGTNARQDSFRPRDWELNLTGFPAGPRGGKPNVLQRPESMQWACAMQEFRPHTILRRCCSLAFVLRCLSRRQKGHKSLPVPNENSIQFSLIIVACLNCARVTATRKLFFQLSHSLGNWLPVVPKPSGSPHLGSARRDRRKSRSRRRSRKIQGY